MCRIVYMYIRTCVHTHIHTRVHEIYVVVVVLKHGHTVYDYDNKSFNKRETPVSKAQDSKF